MRAPARLDANMAIDRASSARRLLTCLTIKWSQSGAKTYFALIRECYELDWLILTKRPQNITKMLPPDWGREYRNVWLGITAEDQAHFNQRWQYLQNIPSGIKFISYEPALGPLHLPKHDPLPNWVISGGESGPKARPINPQWVRDIIAACWQRGIAPFHKQWGTYNSNPLVVEHGLSIEDAKDLDKHGKGGGLVDGKLIREFTLPIR